MFTNQIGWFWDDISSSGVFLCICVQLGPFPPCIAPSVSDIHPLIDNVLSAKGSDNISTKLSQALPPDLSLHDLPIKHKKLQQTLTRTLANTEMMDMIDSALTREDAARFRSLRGRGAGSWLDTVPSSPKLALEPSEIRLASLVRLGCCLTSQSLLGKCDCGRSVDINGYHLLTCKTGGGPVHTHTMLSQLCGLTASGAYTLITNGRLSLGTVTQTTGQT